MKVIAKIKGMEVEVELVKLVIKIDKKLAEELGLTVGTRVTIMSPNQERSQFDSNLSVKEVKGDGEFELKFDSSVR